MSEEIECRLCGRRFTGELVLVDETMYGTGERFPYAQCPGCRSQMLAEVPADLAPYYPTDYYSLDTWEAPAQTGVAARARRLRLEVALRLPVPLVDRLGVRGLMPHYVRWFAGLGIRPDSPILDVGSGGGHTLTNMAIQGFTNLLGVDPFMQDERTSRPVRLMRAEIEDLTESFEVAMINHTLEHVPDPRRMLEATSRRLLDGGHLIVRVPAYDSWAAEHYGTQWAAWDPPRHLSLPTAPGLRAVCESAGLRVVRSYRDGHAFGYWGSEQIRLGIPLRDETSWAENPERSRFSQAQVAEWEKLAQGHNAADRGDALTFVLARA